MQLKKPRRIGAALAAASCALLNHSGTKAATESESDAEWVFDFAALNYDEQDRVHVNAPVFSAKKIYDLDDSMEYRITYDTMTGATPNGATPTDGPQTFTGSSGQTSYTTAANQTPTREFSDKRIALNLFREKPIAETLRRSLGGSFSLESDYASLGFNVSYLKDLNDRATTLSTGFGFSFDGVSPKGGAPDGLVNINAPQPTPSGGGGDEDEDHDDDIQVKLKSSVDFLMGATQVINRYMLMQMNYTRGYVYGYQTDPYKVISVVDGSSGDPVTVLNNGELLNVYLTEKRPKERHINTVFWKSVINLNELNVLRLSYRYFWDDWDVRSHTATMIFRIDLWGGFYLQPQYRYYKQTAANFYRHSLRNDEPTPAYASADFRLAAMESETYGLKLGMAIGQTTVLDLRYERMTQTGDSFPSDAIGSQRAYNLYPTLKAKIIQLSFTTKF